MNTVSLDPKQLESLAAAGHGRVAIAKMLGCNRQTLRAAAARQGLVLPEPKVRMTSISMSEVVRLAGQGLSLSRIAAALQCDRHTLAKTVRLRGAGLTFSRGRAGAQNAWWKGGRTKGKNGYIYVWCPDHPAATSGGYVLEHRLVVERRLGRYLTRREVVHHRDGNPSNNDPDNLVHFGSNAEHLQEELTGRTPNWTPDGKARIAEGNHKKRGPLSQEQRTAISDRQRGKRLSPERAARQAAMLRERNQSAEHREKVSRALLGHTVSAETRAKLSQWRRQRQERQPVPNQSA